ncbi:hypothetical protein AWQ21_13285 [Picosynechococcus sp. PCC 7003]|uniref:HepT-like ribonuclease domain-containing protein n=1 Tax=Picosynechococcus sp. PCC 7003 TaxID=374981 RepID=UPI000810C58B|nr:DUF86 domain-containing protein [Picosynechococcus sp. PCC 7003]ANV85259.1 hypothetical protein AWQ21_13285 [Picosynechococcus sp. PCC 7003]
MSSSRSEQARIQDILNSITSIQKHVANLDFDDFCGNETIQKAVLYDLIVIGEPAKNISSETQAKANIPWHLMGDMRNIMAHEYFQVNLKITWSTIQNNLPTVIEPLEKLLRNLR